MVIQERNLRRTCQGMLVGLVCLLASLLFLHISAYAATTIKKGIVEVGSSRLNLRSEPNTSSTIVKKLYTGDTGVIVEERLGEGGYIWYYMEIMNVTGWARSDLVRVETVTIEDDKNFEEYMIAQGFPESYKAQLRILHSKYPNWVFQAAQTNLTWAEVIAGESVVGKNTIENWRPTSWKSTEPGAYNWETGTWYEKDTGGWVAASSELVQYYMDPRNFLDETYIFQFMRQSYNANEYDAAGLEVVKAGLVQQVQGTFLTGTCDGEPYVDVIMRAAAQEGVSPYVLAAMIIQEIGVYGDSGSISGTVPGYEGLYNYYNVGAFASGNLTAIQKGLQYAGGSGSYGRPWNTRYKAIAGGAEYYASGYVKVAQDTLYLKKFNVLGTPLYGHQYMTNTAGAANEGKILSRAHDDVARQRALVFKIPVYRDMPATACVRPTGDGDPNYMLKSLGVSGYQITPTFNMYETNYSLIVPNEIGSVDVAAQALASTASVAGGGVHQLNVGNNTIQITVTAQSGAKRVYQITIVRQEASVPQPPQPPAVVIPTPSIGSTTYAVNNNNTITGITSFPISAAEFASRFAVTNGSLKIVNGNGSPEGGNIGTGDQLIVSDNAGVESMRYTIVIYGDVNGDGRVNAQDLLTIQKNNIRIATLTGAHYTAADVNRDGRVNAQDLLVVQKHNIRLQTIQQ